MFYRFSPRTLLVSKRSILGAAIVSLGSLSSAGFAFLAQAMLARVLQPGFFGEFTSSLAVVNIILPLAAFGAPQILLKLYGEDVARGHSSLRDVLHFSAITTAVAVVILIAWLALSQSSIVLTAWFFPLILCTAAISLSMSIAQIQDNILSVFFWQNLQNFTRFAAVAFLVVAQVNSPEPYAAGYGLTALVIALLASIHLVRYVKKHHVYEARPNGAILDIGRMSWKYGVEGFLYLMYYNAAVLIIAMTISNEAAGFYAAAAAALAMVYLVPSAVFQRYMLPKLHYAAYHDPQLLKNTQLYGSTVAFLAGCGVMFAAWFSADQVVMLVFGQQYENSTDIFKVLLLSIPIKFATFSLGAVMATGNLQLKKVKIMAGAAALSAILVFLLSRTYGLTGGAVAIVITDIYLLIAMSLGIRRRHDQ